MHRMLLMALFVASLALPLRAQEWRLFVDFGPNFPLANFTSDVNGGTSINAGIERRFRQFSLEAVFGRHTFDAAFADSRFSQDTSANQLSFNGKKFFGAGPLQPFVHLGAGVYAFSPGTQKFGANGGGGVLWRINPRWGLEAAYNYHSADEAEFSVVQGGVRVSL